MKCCTWFGASALMVAFFLVGCGKKPEVEAVESSAQPAAANDHPSRRTNPPISAARSLPSSTATSAVARATVPAAQTNQGSGDKNAPVAPPKKVYPAQHIYEQALALIKTNEVDKAAEEALKLFRTAAEKGNAPAQHALAVLYLGGIGVPKNETEALRWLQQSADAGYAEAQFKLASLYARGGIVPQDDLKAAEFARRAAEQGHAEAEYNLGTLYALGRGVTKDEKAAAEWFKKAAEQGQPGAESNLGVLYANGEVFEKNMAEAVKWWRKAAEQGQPSAQFNLGQTLVEGKAVPKDLVEAYKWFYLAADQGDKQAAEFRDAVGLDLQPTEVADALKRARQFRSELMAKWEAEKQKAF